MPITELVIGTLKPEVSQEGLEALRTGVATWSNAVPGFLVGHATHVLKHNGKNIASENKPILAIEWNAASDFHAFYPASEGFQVFIGTMGPYIAAKSEPRLFEPSPNSGRSLDTFSRGAAQIFIAAAASEKKDDVLGAWEKLLEVLKGVEVKQWSGWGLEEAEGTWVGILGWKGVEEIDQKFADANATEAVQKLKGISSTDEYVVSLV